MEALVLLFIVIADIFALAVVPLVMLVFEVIAELLALVGYLALQALDVFRSRRSGSKPAPTDAAAVTSPAEAPFDTAVPAQRTARIRQWSRRLAVSFGTIIVLTLIPILTANFLFFEATVRTVANRVAKRSGVTIKFETASGNLFSGTLQFEKVRVIRRGHPKSDYNLQIEKLHLQFSVLSLLAQGRRHLTRLEVQGIEGTFDRIAPGDPEQKKPLFVRDLDVGDLKLKVADFSPPGGAVNFNLDVDRLAIDDYDNEWAIWEILFTSNTRGKINGEPFEIKSATNGIEHTSEWTASRIPVPAVVAYLDAPFNLLADGNTEITVKNHWHAGEDAEIDLDWEIVFTDLKAKVPPFSHPAVVQFSKPVVGYLNDHANRLPLSFHVVLNRQAFKGKASLETVGLWKVVHKSATRTLEDLVGGKFELVAQQAQELKAGVAKKAGEQIDQAKAVGRKAGARLKGAFKKDANDKTDNELPANE